MIVEMASIHFTEKRGAEMYIKGNEIKDITVFLKFEICINKNTNEITDVKVLPKFLDLGDEFCGYGFLNL